jgi:hypothetical protein
MAGIHRGLIPEAVVLSVAVIFLGGAGQAASGAETGGPRTPLPPYARTGYAELLDRTEGVLIGFVNPRGPETTAQFEVGRTRSYGASFPPGEPEHFYYGFHVKEISTGIDRLRPETTYHYRIVARSEGGTTYGKDKTFRTKSR